MNEIPVSAPVSSAPKEERTMAMVCHLLAFAGLAFPFGNIIGPLVIWVIKKDQMPLVADQGKESLNFQIALTIYLFIAGVLCFAFIGFLILPVLGIFGVVMTIIAAVKASEGVTYRYPFIFRLIS